VDASLCALYLCVRDSRQQACGSGTPVGDQCGCRPAGDKALSLRLVDEHGNMAARDVLAEHMGQAPRLVLVSAAGGQAGDQPLRWQHDQQELAELPASAWQLHMDQPALVLAAATSLLGPADAKAAHRLAVNSGSRLHCGCLPSGLLLCTQLADPPGIS
jgi:hypothetical protein